MKLENLIANLHNPHPAIRIDVARVLGMLDEARALKAVGEAYKQETDPDVRAVLAWTGKRLYAAQQAGYSTLDEIFRHFRINNEIDHASTKEEQEMIHRLQADLDAELARRQDDAARRKVGSAVAMGLAGAVLGGASMGMTMAMSAGVTPGADVLSSNMGSRPETGVQRTPAAMPSTADIKVWVKRLRESASPADREKAALELLTLNNPAALPFLGSAFMSDPSPQVQAAVQRVGKLLYWGVLYWTMEQDGSLAQEIAQRAAARGKPIPDDVKRAIAPSPAQPEQPARPEQDISAILRAAEAGRKRRMKGH